MVYRQRERAGVNIGPTSCTKAYKFDIGAIASPISSAAAAAVALHCIHIHARVIKGLIDATLYMCIPQTEDTQTQTGTGR